MKPRILLVLLSVTLAVSLLGFITFLRHTPRAQVPVSATSEDGAPDITEANSYAAAVKKVQSEPSVSYQVGTATPQFVVLSFDGSKSIDMLNETLAFQKKLQQEGKLLHFTYFVNAAYFLTKETSTLYQAPKEKLGVSNIGFASSSADIALRVKTFNTAVLRGNEIGSHTVGHFNGASWSYENWKQEFDSFTSLLTNVQKNNPSASIEAPHFTEHILGFRAPNLGVDDVLYKALSDFHFTYDASGVGGMSKWPFKDSYGIWHVPLGTIAIGEKKRPVVAIDYSLWAHQSNLKNNAVKGTPLWNTHYDEVVKAYMDYFTTNYGGSRAPIVIGDHFTKWNDGLYWEALKTFAENVCGKPEVHCVTFSELVDYLNTKGPPQTKK